MNVYAEGASTLTSIRVLIGTASAASMCAWVTTDFVTISANSWRVMLTSSAFFSIAALASDEMRNERYSAGSSSTEATPSAMLFTAKNWERARVSYLGQGNRTGKEQDAPP